MLAQFRSVLEQVVRSPTSTVADLDLCTAEAAACLADPTLRLDERPPPSVASMVASSITQRPDDIAVEMGSSSLSYQALGELAADVARRLDESGGAPGATVAVQGPRCIGTIVAMLGVIASGRVLLTLAPELPPERHRNMLSQADVGTILAVGPEILDHQGALLRLGLDGRNPEAAAAPGVLSSFGERAEALDRTIAGNEHDAGAYLFFTSGSTGNPKGTQGSHAGLAHFLDWQRTAFDVGPGDRCSHLVGLSFDVVLRDVFLPLCSGATLVIPEHVDARSGPDLLDWFEAESISIVHTVPSVLESWLIASEPIELPTLRVTFCAGEPLRGSVVDRWRRIAPSGRVINLYGPTETSLAKFWYEVPAHPVSGVQPLGQALPASQAIVIGASGRQCGVGETGEIAIRTPFRSRGYLANPEEQARRFVPNPFASGDQATAGRPDLVYLTGDRGLVNADGQLEFRGRVDFQVKIRGVRIEPSEVTAVLAEADGVSTCAVVVRTGTDGEPQLVAYVVPEADAEPSWSELREHLARRMPAAMVPSAFVQLAELPLTPNDKLDRDRLPDPSSERSDGSGAYVAPRSAMELGLVQVWEEMLGIEPIGVTDDFFALGGHSLMALRLLVLIEERLGKKLSPATLFEHPTVEQLAVAPDEDDAAMPRTVQMSAGDDPVNLFLVHPGGGVLWNYVHLARHLKIDSPIVGIQAAGLDGLEEPHADVAAMVECYLAEIRARQPKGPYLLAGHSFGGVIAFEIGRQLEEQGECVAFLGLLDSVAPTARVRPAHAPSADRVDAERLYAMVRTIARFLDQDLDLRVEDLVELEEAERLRHVVATLETSGALPPGQQQETVRNLLRVSKSHMAAHETYEPARAGLAITLVVAANAELEDYTGVAEDLLERADRGWNELTTDAVQVVRSAGNHVTMLNETNAPRLAARLGPAITEALRAARATGDGRVEENA